MKILPFTQIILQSRYNRFRLVLAKQSDDVISDNLIKDFQKTAGHDEKAHIHFVSQQELPNVPEIA